MYKVIRAICSAIMLLGAAFTAQARAACVRQTIAMSFSPDDRWVALVREGECSNGASVTVSTDTVQLVPRKAIDTVSLARLPDKSQHENDVLVVDYYGRFENRPLLKWVSRRQLQIIIPNISGIGLRKSNYHDIAIAIRFDPDDPAAREKWRKERGLPPE